jgi:hypothetical protein
LTRGATTGTISGAGTKQVSEEIPVTTLHIIVEISEQVPTGRTEWRVDCAECEWYDIFDDRRRAEDGATTHVAQSHASETTYNRIVQTLRIEPNPEESDLIDSSSESGR